MQLKELPPPSKLRRMRRDDLCAIANEVQAHLGGETFATATTKRQLASFIEAHWEDYQKTQIFDSDKLPDLAIAKNEAQRIYEALSNLATATADPKIADAKNAIGDWLHTQSLMGVHYV